MLKNKKIILIGFMGAGKSFLGEKLSEELDLPFFDSDIEIETKNKRSISDIFSEEGEEAFRKKERQLIVDFSKLNSFILATGGGMPCYLNNMDKLNELGDTIYLKVPTKILAERLSKDNTDRPLILGNDLNNLIKFIQEKISVREMFYSNAKYTIEYKDHSIDKLKLLIENGELS